MNSDELKNRTKKFALRILKVLDALPKEPGEPFTVANTNGNDGAVAELEDTPIASPVAVTVIG